MQSKNKKRRGQGRQRKRSRSKLRPRLIQPYPDAYRPDKYQYEDWSLCHLIMSMQYSYRKSKAEYRVQRIGKGMTIRIGVSPVQHKCVGITNRQGCIVTKGCPPNRMIAKSLAGIRMPIAKNKQFNKHGRPIKARMGKFFTERDDLDQVEQRNINVEILGMLNKDANSASRVAEWAKSMRAIQNQNAITKYQSDPKNWTRGKHGGLLK